MSRAHDLKSRRLLDNVSSIAKHEDVTQFLRVAHAARPLALRVPWIEHIPLMNIVQGLLGGFDYNDSTRLEMQKPALYAADEILKRGCGKVLYAASSWGVGLKLLDAAGYDVTGVDINKRAVTFCQSQGLDARLMDASNLEFSDRTFDMVISRDLVDGHYLSPRERIAFLDEQHRVTKSGGAVVFTTLVPEGRKLFGRKLPSGWGLPLEGEVAQSALTDSRKSERRITLHDEYEGKKCQFPLRYYFKH